MVLSEVGDQHRRLIDEPGVGRLAAEGRERRVDRRLREIEPRQPAQTLDVAVEHDRGRIEGVLHRRDPAPAARERLPRESVERCGMLGDELLDECDVLVAPSRRIDL
jgi:hypothetical protein